MGMNHPENCTRGQEVFEHVRYHNQIELSLHLRQDLLRRLREDLDAPRSQVLDAQFGELEG